MINNMLTKIFQLEEKSSHRVSSWDRTGANRDFILIRRKKTKILAEIEGPGVINRIYFTWAFPHPLDYRNAIIKIYWDYEENPSVYVPLGDFFAICNCRVRTLNSLGITITRAIGGSYGHNIYFPMPFSRHAKIEIENQGPRNLGGFLNAFWYHIDYDKVDKPWSEDIGYFHAYWNQEKITKVEDDIPKKLINKQLWEGKNITGRDNYVILDTEGNGQLVGLLLGIDNIAGGWYGEGDDMIFIDDDSWPPSLHGTGHEEIFGVGACPIAEFNTPYSGFHIIENFDYSGINGMYRWYISDPIRFKKRIRWTIEHGHSNNFENNYTSVAYWYQKEPHKKFNTLGDLKERHPRVPDDLELLWSQTQDIGLKILLSLKKRSDPDFYKLVQETFVDLMEGRYQKVRDNLPKIKKKINKSL